MAVSATYFCAILLITVSSSISTGSGKQLAGCTAPLTLPNKPFFVVWNHPSQLCESHGIHIDFEKWGIVDNTKDRFLGEQITLFYNLGSWPHYSGSRAYNGGIPQLANETAHLEKVQKDIKNIMPDQSFSGLSVIDFEYWRPLYSLNWDKLKIYQTKSLELAKQEHPQYNKSRLEHQAMREFNIAARSFVGKTLQEALALRPKGLWGYYGYPRCWNTNCDSKTWRTNDKMTWVFNTSTALYPSIYFDLGTPPATRADRIKKKIHETIRIKGKWSPQDVAILPYALSQNGPYSLFTDSDLSYSIGQPANMGSSGVVLWGSSSSMRAKNECLVLQDYISTTLGPYSLKVMNFFGNCTEQLCQGHGRCVRKDYEAVYQHHLRESRRSDCQIPKSQLVRNKKKNVFTTVTEENHTGSKGSTILKTESQKLWKCCPYSGVNSKIKRPKSTPVVNLMSFLKTGQNDNEALQRKWKKKDVTVDSVRSNKLGTHDFTNENRAVNRKISNPVLSSDFDPPTPSEFEPNVDETSSGYMSPMYDFDDYVCKCFAGWSGPHCENKLED